MGGGKMVIALLIIFGLIFVSGYYIGFMYPPGENSKQDLLAKRIGTYRKRLLTCEKGVANLRLSSESSNNFADTTRERTAFLRKDMADLKDQMELCESSRQMAEMQLRQCFGEKSGLSQDLHRTEYVGAPPAESDEVDGDKTPNVEGILDLASKESSVEVLKEIATRLKHGETVRRDRVIRGLLDQVETTRMRLRKLRESCGVNEKFNVTQEVMEDKSWLRRATNLIQRSAEGGGYIRGYRRQGDPDTEFDD